MIEALTARRPTPTRVALVVAHPDDETIAAGASLQLLSHLLLIHVTDGAPRTGPDAQAAGFATPAAYAAARHAELAAALALSQATPACVTLAIPDQEASLDMRSLAHRLATLFQTHQIETVLTHAYEGGHPDHDATAWAVHQAARCPILEFPGYHAAPDGALVTGQFLPGPLATAIPLTAAEQAQKIAMLACFKTQATILAAFGTGTERFRPAPAYDFARPPHPGTLNYEHWGWDMTGDRWRTLAQAARCAA